MNMTPIVMDTSFTRIAAVDDYSSFIWTERYYKPGDFQLVVAITARNMNLFKRNYYICRDGRKDVGIIEQVKISSNDHGVMMMTVSGRFLSSIVGRRIIAQQREFDNVAVTGIVQSLLDEAIISPTIPERKIPNFSFANDSSLSTRISVQYTGKNLLEVIEGICQNYGLGFRVTLENGSFVFHLYQGTDRSYGQKANTFVVFSQNYDNLESSDYEEDYSTLVTDVLVAGEGEGTDRKTVWASKQTNSGLARYEAFTDARNSSTNNGEISDSVYLAQLRAEGLDEITSITKAFAGKVHFTGYVYDQDIFIGDICTIINSEWGIGMNTRLVEMIESTSESGEYTTTPTFGT